MTNTPIQDMDISEIIGLSGLVGAEQEDMLERIGSLILESVMLRVIAGMSDEEASAFESFVATDPSPEQMNAYIQERVPDIDSIFEEERAAFREECIRIFGTESPVK